MIDKKSIGFKVLVTIIPIMILTSFIITGYSYFSTKNEVENLAENLLMQVSKDTALIIQKEIRGNAQASEDIANYISEKGVVEKNDIVDLLKSKISNTAFKSLAFADKNGDYIDVNGNVTNIADSDHFKMAIEGTRAASELYKSSIDGSLEVAYCAPIKINEEIIGVVVATKDGLEYSNIANSIDVGNDGFAFILDKTTKQILAYPDAELVNNLSSVDDLVNSDKKYASFGDAANDMVTNIQGVTKYKFEGDDILVVHTGILSDYWIMGIAINENSILSNINRTGVILLAISLILIIIASASVVIIAKSISSGAKKLNDSINEIAQGNFNKEIDSELKKSNNEFGEIARNLEKINTNISGMVNKLKDISDDVNESSNNVNSLFETVNSNNVNIAQTINEVAQGNSMQTDNLSNITIKMDSFSNLLTDMAGCISAIDKVSREIDLNATSSNEDMTIVISAIKELNSKFNMFTNIIKNMESKFSGITNITKLIHEISEKTNLLSLNAAIESARAGEAGKGFSVVAEEIRKLANESSNSTQEINNVIESILFEMKSLVSESVSMSNYMNEQNNSISKAISSFKDISDSISKIKPMIIEVTDKSGNIDSEKTEIISSIEGLLAISEEVTASADGISSLTEEITKLSENAMNSSIKLVGLTDTMNDELRKFKTK